MAEDPLQVDALIEAEHAAEEARRSGEDELVPPAVQAAYDAGNGVDAIARVTGLPVKRILELLELAE